MGTRDAFGHVQLGGVAPTLAQMVKQAHGYKFHWALADYLQRSARHIASRVDVEQAYAVGRAAVELALAGKNAVMPVIRRKSSKPYRWDIASVAIEAVANKEKMVPRGFHHRRRLRHHRRRPPLPRAADRRRGVSALQERHSAVRDAQGRARAQAADHGFHDMILGFQGSTLHVDARTRSGSRSRPASSPSCTACSCRAGSSRSPRATRACRRSRRRSRQGARRLPEPPVHDDRDRRRRAVRRARLRARLVHGRRLRVRRDPVGRGRLHRHERLGARERAHGPCGERRAEPRAAGRVPRRRDHRHARRRPRPARRRRLLRRS